MFVRSIGETAFASKVADELFADRGLRVGAYRGDLSLQATLRALLLNRPTGKVMADVDEPTFSYQEIESEEGLRENIRKVILGYDFFDDSNYESILAISALTNFHNAQTIMDRIMERLGELLPGFRELKDLREFVKNYSVNARFLIDEERKRTVIIVDRLTNRTFHFLQAFISRYFPWYFGSNKLHGEEKKLIEGLTKRTPDEYIAALNEIAKDEDGEYSWHHDDIEMLMRAIFEEEIIGLRVCAALSESLLFATFPSSVCFAATFPLGEGFAWVYF